MFLYLFHCIVCSSLVSEVRILAGSSCGFGHAWDKEVEERAQLQRKRPLEEEPGMPGEASRKAKGAI